MIVEPFRTQRDEERCFEPASSQPSESVPLRKSRPNLAVDVVAECADAFRSSYWTIRELRLGKQSHPIVLRNVNYAGIDAVAIVNQQSLRLVAWQDGTDLLDRPRGCGLLGHVPIGDPPGSNITSSLRTTRGVTGTVDRRLDVDVCLHVGAERQCVYA